MSGRWSLQKDTGLGQKATLGRSFRTWFVLVCVIQRAAEEPPERLSCQKLIVERVRER